MVWGRSQSPFFFFWLDIHLFQQHLLKWYTFCPWNILALHLVENQLIIYMWVCFCFLCSMHCLFNCSYNNFYYYWAFTLIGSFHWFSSYVSFLTVPFVNFLNNAMHLFYFVFVVCLHICLLFVIWLSSACIALSRPIFLF